MIATSYFHLWPNHCAWVLLRNSRGKVWVLQRVMAAVAGVSSGIMIHNSSLHLLKKYQTSCLCFSAVRYAFIYYRHCVAILWEQRCRVLRSQIKSPLVKTFYPWLCKARGQKMRASMSIFLLGCKFIWSQFRAR